MKRIMVVDGPNLGLLGSREPDVYGEESRGDLIARLSSVLPADAYEVDFRQSDWEGELTGWINEASRSFDGLVINPGALTHFHYGVRDALAACVIPVIEVHMTQIFSREDWRRNSVTAPACDGFISGLGWRSYQAALLAMAGLLEDKQ